MRSQNSDAVRSRIADDFEPTKSDAPGRGRIDALGCASAWKNSAKKSV
jgi:hypothetical protein